MKSKRWVLAVWIFIGLCSEVLFAEEGVVQAPEAAPPPAQEAASAGKISLDLKGVNILDVLKLISKESGLNIVAGPNVRGTVTIFLKEVDIWDALRIVLVTNDLAYEREGSLIQVLTDADYERLYGERFHDKTEIRTVKLRYSEAQAVSQALNQVKTRIGRIVIDERANTLILIDVPERLNQMEEITHQLDIPSETRIYELNYAVAEEVKTKIEEILTKGVGKARLDKRTNKLAVTDTAEKLQEVQKIIEAFDERSKEVLIDAKIIQIDLNDEHRLGVQWEEIFAGVDAQAGEHFSVIEDVLGATSPAAGGALRIGTLDSQGYKILFEALTTVGRTEVISSPRIATLNNQEAKVLVGTKQPFVTETTTTPGTGASITAESVTYIDVGVNLTVTPTIMNDGFIQIKVRPEVSSLGTPLTTRLGNKIPVVSTSQAETNILVKDGNTIVLAGLIENRETETLNKIPLLGSLPMVGSFFRSKSRGDTNLPEKQEKVIFLTPHIITGDQMAPEWKSFSTSLEERREAAGFALRQEMEKKPNEDKRKPGKLGGEELTSRTYYRTLSEKIGQKLRQNAPEKLSAGEIHLSFALLSNGQLVGEPEVLNTIGEELKKAAIRSVKEASPFPPFPETIPGTQRTFKLVVSFE